MGEIPVPIVEALPTTKPPKYIWWPLHGCRARWRKEIKKVHG